MTPEQQDIFASNLRRNSISNLYEITRDVVSKLDINEAIDAILRCATQGLNARAADMTMYDETTGLWYIFAEYNKVGSSLGVSAPLERFDARLTGVLNGESVLLNDFGEVIQRDADALAAFTTEEEREFWFNLSVLVAPLWRDGTVIGFISAYDDARPHRFRQVDAEFLNIFAGTASIALINAGLYSDLQQATLELECKVEERTRELAEANTRLAQAGKQLSEAFDATIRLQEDERTRFAQELHDSSCQLVAGALFELQAVLKNFESGQIGSVPTKIEYVMQILQDLDKENRQIMETAYPILLKRKGLAEALDKAIAIFREHSDSSFTLSVVGAPERFGQREELAMLRIAQEALTNASKHAQANNIWVCLEFKHSELVMTVQDDGIGFEREAGDTDGNAHLGVISINDRAQSINGVLEFESSPHKGTKVKVTLPL